MCMQSCKEICEVMEDRRHFGKMLDCLTKYYTCEDLWDPVNKLNIGNAMYNTKYSSHKI